MAGPLTLADYRDLMRKRRIVDLQGAISREMLNSFYHQLSDIDRRNVASDSRIIVRINSPGGELEIGKVLMTELEALATDELTSIVAHRTASMAPLLLMTFPVERRFGFSKSHCYFHKARMNQQVRTSSTSPDEFDYARKESEEELKNFRGVNPWMIRTLVRGTNLSMAEAKDLLNNPRALNAQTMKRMGIIGHIIK